MGATFTKPKSQPQLRWDYDVTLGRLSGTRTELLTCEKLFVRTTFLGLIRGAWGLQSGQNQSPGGTV